MDFVINFSFYYPNQTKIIYIDIFNSQYICLEKKEICENKISIFYNSIVYNSSVMFEINCILRVEL